MRVKEKTSRIIAFSLLILVFLATNWLGDHVVSRMNWPIWLDSVGTVLCAYQFGPVCGAIVGATFNLLGWVIYDYSWLYAIVSVVIATVVGIAAKRKKLNTLLDTLTTSAILAGITALTAYPINLLTSGSTGNSWGDAVIGFMRERGIPAWAGLLVGELYVELLDKLVILTTMFFIIRLIRFAAGCPAGSFRLRRMDPFRPGRRKKEIRQHQLQRLCQDPLLHVQRSSLRRGQRYRDDR